MSGATMNRRRRGGVRWVSVSAGAAALLALAAGCNPPNRGSQVVADLPEPLVGTRPMPTGQQPDWHPWQPRPNNRPEPQPRNDGRPPVLRSTPYVARGGEAGWVPAGGIARRWECVVVHHSANDRDTPQGMAEWHQQRGWDELGYHFVIGNGVRFGDGEVWVGSRWPKQKTGAHCKVPGNYYNEHGIGICLIGNLDDHGPTARQMESLSRLVSFLCRQCDIPTSHIYTHGGVTHKTECPGRNFSLGELRRRVQRSASVAASSD
ncbi:MAG: peptidoglycan recognition family protein [Phycisphaerae bacterium]